MGIFAMDAPRAADDERPIAGESHNERFRRLAGKRVTRTIKDIRLIGNLGNRNNYEYTDDEVEKIFRTLEKELKLARAKFDGRKRNGGDISFSL
jgi:hypothetical protein